MAVGCVRSCKNVVASNRSFCAACGPQQAAVPGVGAAGADSAASFTSPHHNKTFPQRVEASTSSANYLPQTSSRLGVDDVQIE